MSWVVGQGGKEVIPGPQLNPISLIPSLWSLTKLAMLMNPSQQHAGLQHVVLQLQHDVTVP